VKVNPKKDRFPGRKKTGCVAMGFRDSGAEGMLIAVARKRRRH